MGDSDSERGMGSDAGSDDEGDPSGFDPAKDLDKLSDKERKKWDKRLKQWRIFMDFLFRHISIVTYKFNQFEKENLTNFMIALEKAESIRERMKLKKSEQARINSYKMMKDASDMLRIHKFLAESNRLKEFLNIAGRMRGLGLIAGGFFNAMKKAKLKGADKIKYYMDYWKGFTVRSFDYAELNFRNVDPATFNALERKYLVWLTTVRTALNLSQRFLKKSSECTGLELLNADAKMIQKYMAAPEFVLATKIEDNLFNKVEQGTKSFLLGITNPSLVTPQQQQEDTGKLQLPNVDDIDPDFLKPIPDNGVLLELPPDPPKEKKGKKGRKGKKGKGGKKKSAKGRSVSASSHKGGKKKKKK